MRHARLSQSLDQARRSQFIFTELWPETALAEAEHSPGGALAGKLLCVKDLFDVAGHVTRAGSRFLAKEQPATKDAIAVQRLRSAGAILIGKTTMTELAYSGLGLNPHIGTPENPLKPGHIPGGSTSGGAVAVATGIADLALGTDTGGSVRIPAAFCGITGFKPSQDSVPRQGCVPLSTSLDSIGIMARNVADCAEAWQVLAGRQVQSLPAQRQRLIIPDNFGMTDLDPEVKAGFDHLAGQLRQGGYDIERRPLPVLGKYGCLPVWQFSAVESFRAFQRYIDDCPELFDPRVLSRIKRAHEVTAEMFNITLAGRDELIAQFRDELGSALILLPSVAILPPRFEDVADDADYNRLNLMALRNTSLANVMDGCSLSVPFTHAGETMGAMLTGAGASDEAVLSAGLALEQAIA